VFPLPEKKIQGNFKKCNAEWQEWVNFRHLVRLFNIGQLFENYLIRPTFGATFYQRKNALIIFEQNIFPATS
jgi:hypothetical protein